tara:strand:- start:221 stop:394 length:174 start_codon:yes stop_codon:yes gene_type:complete
MKAMSILGIVASAVMLLFVPSLIDGGASGVEFSPLALLFGLFFLALSIVALVKSNKK